MPTNIIRAVNGNSTSFYLACSCNEIKGVPLSVVVFRDSVVLAIISEGTSLYAGLVIFSVLGYMAKQAGVPISDVVSSGAQVDDCA